MVDSDGTTIREPVDGTDEIGEDDGVDGTHENNKSDDLRCTADRPVGPRPAAADKSGGTNCVPQGEPAATRVVARVQEHNNDRFADQAADRELRLTARESVKPARQASEDPAGFWSTSDDVADDFPVGWPRPLTHFGENRFMLHASEPPYSPDGERTPLTTYLPLLPSTAGSVGPTASDDDEKTVDVDGTSYLLNKTTDTDAPNPSHRRLTETNDDDVGQPQSIGVAKRSTGVELLLAACAHISGAGTGGDERLEEHAYAADSPTRAVAEMPMTTSDEERCNLAMDKWENAAASMNPEEYWWDNLCSELITVWDKTTGTAAERSRKVALELERRGR